MIAWWWPRALAFVFAFSFNVHVRAETAELPNAHDVQQEPDGCLQDKSEAGFCALKTGDGEKFRLKMEHTTITLDEETAFVRQNETSFRLLSGEARIETDKQITVKSEFGDVQSGADAEKSEFWVRRWAKTRRIVASAVKGTITLLPRGSGEKLDVAPGMENWLGAVGSDGHAEFGLPTAIALKPHLERWSRLFNGGRNAFKKAVDEFMKTWRQASEQTAEIHEAVFERKVASIEAEQARKAEAVRKEQEHRKELIRLFRKRELGNE